MRKKLQLDVDGLSVESFATGEGEAQRGTVEAHAGQCTCPASCPCPSAPYYCADAYETSISCDYTANASCWYTNTCPTTTSA